MTGTYASVDDGDDPEAAADWQDRINAWPAIAAYKARSYELLASSRVVLDVGAGTGADLAHHATAVSIGIDRSFTMLRRAAARADIVVAGDAHAIPVRDGAVDGVRADRVVQHLAAPHASIGEMLRVLQPGGTLVVCDPDQGTLAIEVPWAPPDLVARVRDRRRDVQYRNGTFVRELPEILATLGVRDITCDRFPLVLLDPDDAFGLPGWVRHSLAAGDGATAHDVREWDAAIARARTEPGFVYSVSYLVVGGRKEGLQPAR